jgi:epoxyqueuosine reductase
MVEVNAALTPPGAGRAAAQDSGARSDAGEPLAQLAARIKAWGAQLGFGAVGIADVDVAQASERLREWLARGRHGAMHYMARHEALRADPARLLPAGSRPVARAISVRLDYLPRSAAPDWAGRERQRLSQGTAAVVSVYARGRDYHKVLRARLQQLAQRIEAEVGPHGYRVCTDSAPVFEVELARKSGIGWRGKHTLLLAPQAGSMFFLGEILTDLPLPVDAPGDDRCGSCTRCLAACPTGAIVAPYELDARRCISYLTIEHPGPIPLELRPLIGNRVYGCDDCQLACPWNKFARVADLPDFDVRNGLDAATLTQLFAWSEREFDQRHRGSAIRRIGHERWLRNLAVALGNAPSSPALIAALRSRLTHHSPLVTEHVRWALARHGC